NGAIVLYQTNHAESVISGTPESLYGIVHGNGTFVAVGTGGAILTSSNGVNWSNHPQTNLGSLRAVAYGNGTFVALDGFSKTATSTDGMTWTVRALPFSLGPENITFGAGVFVIVASDNEVLSSPDGITWRHHFTPSNEGFYGTTFGHHTFLGVGEDGVIMESADVRPRVTGRFLLDGRFEVTVERGLAGIYRLQNRASLAEAWMNSTGFDHNGEITIVIDATSSARSLYRVTAP